MQERETLAGLFKRRPVVTSALLAVIILTFGWMFFGAFGSAPASSAASTRAASGAAARSQDRALCETAGVLASLIDQGYAAMNAEILVGVEFLKDRADGSSLEATIRALHALSVAGNYSGAAEAWAKLGRECKEVL